MLGSCKTTKQIVTTIKKMALCFRLISLIRKRAAINASEKRIDVGLMPILIEKRMAEIVINNILLLFLFFCERKNINSPDRRKKLLVMSDNILKQ